MQPRVPPLCPLPLLTALWTHSLCQPGPHRGFLLAPASWPAAQQAAQTGETRLKAGRRPGAVPLLPPGVQPQSTEPPTTPHHHLGRAGGAQPGAELCGRGFVQRPGNQPGADRRCDTGAVLAAKLLEAAAVRHFFQPPRHRPPGALHLQHVGRQPGLGVQRGDAEQPSRHGQGERCDRAPGLWGGAARAASGAPRRGRRQLGRPQPHRLPLPFPATPPVPVALGVASLPQPAQPIAGLSRLGCQGDGGRGAPPPYASSYAACSTIIVSPGVQLALEGSPPASNC